jgi:putative addiction module antidote protein, CC2985 family
MNVSLPEAMEEFVRQKVAIGDYETASEVVREGLRLLKQRDEVWKADVRDKSSKVWIQSAPVVPFQRSRSKPRWLHSKKSGRRIVTLNEGYELSPEATDDLQEIWVYIANDNPIAADKLEEDHLCSMRAAREKSASWSPTLGLDGRTRPVLAGAGNTW